MAEGKIAAGEAQGEICIDFFDPHFHIWGPPIHDMDILFAPGGEDPHYGVDRYEAEFNAAGYVSASASASAAGPTGAEGGGGEPADGAPRFRVVHAGGVFVEALSVCFPSMPAEELNVKCLEEATFASDSLAASTKPYTVVGSLCLEDAAVEEHMKALVAIPNVVGIRQVVNKEPSWPRNGDRADFLLDEQWQKGFGLLQQHSACRRSVRVCGCVGAPWARLGSTG